MRHRHRPRKLLRQRPRTLWRQLFGAAPQDDLPWRGLEPLENRLLLAAPEFATALFNEAVPTDGNALTVGIDGADADGDSLTITAVSDDPNLTAFVPQGNRFARLNFTEADGVTAIGSIFMELFETRGDNAAEQFIRLATDPLLGDGVNPFYTNVPVHRVVPGFVIQTGDGANGNGSGGSPLGPYLDQFELQDGLSYANAGVVGAANSGPNTSDSQWFITAAATQGLNGLHMILGHMISGLDVFNDLIGRPNTGAPSNATLAPVPLLASVDILDRAQDTIQDGTVTFTAQPGWDGRAQVTVSLDDGNGGVTQQVVTIVSEQVLGNLPVIDMTGDQFIAAEQIVQFDINDDGDLPLDIGIFTSTNPQMPTAIDADNGFVLLQPPAGSDLIYDIQIQASEAGFNRSPIAISRVKAISQTADAPPILGRATSVATENVFGTFLDGDLLYAANGTLGLDIYDVSDPANPLLQDFFDTPGTARDVVVMDNVAYLADGANGLMTLDVTDPTNIQLLDTSDPGVSAVSVFVENGIAYVAADDDGLVTYDVSNPGAIAQLGAFDVFLEELLDINDALDVLKDENFVFLSDPTIGVICIDVTDPTNMSFVGIFASQDENSDPLNPEGMDLDNDVLYVTTRNGLSLFDVSVPNAPTGIVNVALTNLPSRVDVANSLAVVAATGGFFFLDVADPAAPVVEYTFGAGRFDGNTIGVDVAVTPSINGTQVALPLFNSGTLIMDASSTLVRPVVSDLQVNQGLAAIDGPAQFAGQRSQLLNFAVTFGEQMVVDVDDVELIFLGMNPGVDVPAPVALSPGDLTQAPNGDGTFDLTIDLSNQVLADGVYELRLKTSLLDSAGLGLHESQDYVFRAHQLLGDFDGDKDFDATGVDLTTMQHWFAQPAGTPAPGFIDTNASGKFNLLDVGPFTQTLGTTLTYENPDGFEAGGASAAAAQASSSGASASQLAQLLSRPVTLNEVQAAAALWSSRADHGSPLSALRPSRLVVLDGDDPGDDANIVTPD